jgi:8-oxo-dGTP diphosphatase
VLLVRHGAAGSSETWSGDDRERPLDTCGIAQADELVRILSRFEVGRIVSADVRRCVDTVQPLADAFGLEVAPEALLSEEAYPGREDEAEAMVRGLGDPEHDAVACSQGTVIPDLLKRMAAADGLPLEAAPRSPKGSTWALSLDADGRLVALDFFAAPAPTQCH